MRIAMYEYIEINLVGVVLLLTMLFYMHKTRDNEQNNENRYFKGMVIINALILLADNGIYLMRGHGTEQLIAYNHMICIAYFALHVWFCFCWVSYVLNRLYPSRLLSNVREWIIALPALAVSIFVAVTPLTGWVYTLTTDNVYHRGPLVWITFLGAAIYWVFSTVIIIHEMKHPVRSREKGDYWALLIFPLPIAAGYLIQILYYGISTVWVLAAISMLLLFIDMQNEQMSRDTLTGLYNRRQTDTQLEWELNHLRFAHHKLLVVMFDMDFFKSINDTYGHLAGDQALAEVGRILKHSCRRSDFVSRFGGDEFLMVGRIKQDKDAEVIIGRIRKALETINRSGEYPYKLSLSIGYIVCGSKDNKNMDAVIREADMRMYEEKNNRKKYG